MQNITEAMRNKAIKLLKSGTVSSVLGWKSGILPYDPEPAFFSSAEEIENMVSNGFCGSNLSKYLVEKDEEKRILVFLKPCDTYSLNQLLRENRVKRDEIYAIGIGCDGNLDILKLRKKGLKGIEQILEENEDLKIKTIYGNTIISRQEALLEKCRCCKGKDHKVYDELIGADESVETTDMDRFHLVEEQEGKTSDERFVFWREKLSNCIRCNACRNICPVCSCRKCIFDNTQYDISGKVNVSEFEENSYHIIRAFHVAGRCSDCGECSRVCPHEIPLHLLNRKLIKDINSLYGEYQAGETAEQISPLLSYELDDAEPGTIIAKRGDD